MFKPIRRLSIFFIIILSFSIMAQDLSTKSIKNNRIGGFIGYNHYTGGAFNNYRSFFIALVGLEYDYRFSDIWGFGLKLDLINPQYSIPYGLDLPDIVIAYPSAMIKYYFSNYLNLLGGVGVEIIEGSSYSTIKFGGEYHFILADGWDIKPIFSYSIVNKFKDTYELSFSIGKSF